jgi:hypothetical protein
VSTQDVGRGAAFVFKTSGEVRPLRERTAHLVVPAQIESAPRRLDNIHGGVRLVFETEAAADVDALRRDVRAHARRIAQVCGLIFTKPADAHGHARDPEEAGASTSRASDAARVKRHNTEQKSPEDSKAEKSKADKRQKDALQATPKPKPKPKQPAKQNGKPRKDDKPKEDQKPPLPRLPGVQPQPLPQPRVTHRVVERARTIPQRGPRSRSPVPSS